MFPLLVPRMVQVYLFLYSLMGAFRDDPDGVLVLIDLANAFNCVSRWAVLSAVRKHFPWMSPWAGHVLSSQLQSAGGQVSDS